MQFKIYLPPPTNWQDFQLLVQQIAIARYNPETVVEYGRSGQRQNGVDVFAEDLSGKKIGIQCKETKKSLVGGTVRAEADAAMSFATPLDLFIVATTDRIDARVQDTVIALNDSGKYGFRIRVEFWDDLVNDINRYAAVLDGCYMSYRQQFQHTDEVNHLACLRVAFDRPAFKDDFHSERNLSDFEEALAATKRLFRTGFLLDRWSQLPVVQTVPIDFLPHGEYRKFVSGLETAVDKLYRTYIADKKKLMSDGQYAQDRAGHYNILRRVIVGKLNLRLTRQSLDEIECAFA